MAKRIVGGIFTLGLVPLFKWPHTYYDIQRFDLSPAAGGVPVVPAADAGQRLERLERLWKEGKISEVEYQNARQKVLDELSH